MQFRPATTRFSQGRLLAALLLFICAAIAGADDVRSRYLIELDGASTAHARTDVAIRQDELVARIRARLSRPVEPVYRYRHVSDALVIALTREEAQAISVLPGVRQLLADVVLGVESVDDDMLSLFAAGRPQDTEVGEPMPDPVAELLGAPGVWDGSATGLPGNLGEGVIVGVLGPGINGGHPSFAARGDDDYTHVNPLGSGVYLGECLQAPEIVCNDKLIGRWTFADGAADSEDETGYGSFAAGQAAGNRLYDVELADFAGNPSGLRLDMMAGIAPHASLIAYRTCAPLCSASDIIRAMDQVVEDGVDVLIYVVGYSDDSPWANPVALAMKSLRAAGISVTVGTGVHGPAYGSASGAALAPWTASFTSGSHGREFSRKELGKFAGGDSAPMDVIFGAGASTGITAPVVDAADYPNPNDPGGDSAQCLFPFPAGTFNGEIVLCDRGAIPRYLKSIHVRDGGAGGIVLANTEEGPSTLAADIVVLAGIHVLAADGAAIRDWLSTGSGHSATITAAMPINNADNADILGTFSSRGPNGNLDFLVPSLSAPSQGIYGATAPPALYAYRNGRGSHPGAGAIALLRSLHPDWTAAEVLSALMTTGVTTMREADTLEQSDPFGYGGGRVDVAAAARAALVLDATDADFDAANPLTGGSLRDLNLAGLVDNTCLQACSWTRTLRATQAGSWVASAAARDGDIVMRVFPEQFTLAAGEQQTIDVQFDGFAVSEGGIRFGEVTLASATDVTTPPTRLQVAVDLLLDNDGDGVANRNDNCVTISNPGQRDSNGDGYGNRCDADLDDDGIVNSIDLGLMRMRIGTADVHADLDGDGQVGGADVDIMRALFHAPPGPSSAVVQR